MLVEKLLHGINYDDMIALPIDDDKHSIKSMQHSVVQNSA